MFAFIAKIFPVFLVVYSFNFKLCCSDCVVINMFNCLS